MSRSGRGAPDQARRGFRLELRRDTGALLFGGGRNRDHVGKNQDAVPLATDGRTDGGGYNPRRARRNSSRPSPPNTMFPSHALIKGGTAPLWSSVCPVRIMA